eukprot:6217040-Amphidinium_carterae.2
MRTRDVLSEQLQVARSQDWPHPYCGHTHTGEIMMERIEEADSRLERIMCLPGAPLSIKRKLVGSFVCPVLYGSCFSRVPSRAWSSLCDKVWRICFGRTRYAASKHLSMAVCYGAQLWMTHAWSIAEMARVIHAIASTPYSLRESKTIARLTSAFSPMRQPSPLIDGWISWCNTFGGHAFGADVLVEDHVVLHSSLSSSAWKGEARHLHRVTSIFRVNRQSRNLVNLEPHSLDTYLVHHVLCTDHEDHGVETFATGGVISRDRLYCHSKGLLDSALCEDACVDAHEVPLCDTPIHRAYYCSATDAVRASVEWTLYDETLIFRQGNACAAYGLWDPFRAHWQDLRSSVMNVISADFLESLYAIS